jgi:CBS domain-containing protein
MLTTVRDLLKVKGNAVWYVSPETSVNDALKYMADRQIGALLVLEDDHIAGIVSERDFVRKIAEQNACELDHPVREYMTQKVFTINPSQTIEDCMKMMTEKHIRHLPVVENDKLVGLISIGDVVKGIITSQEFTIEQLSKYIDGGGYNQ